MQARAQSAVRDPIAASAWTTGAAAVALVVAGVRRACAARSFRASRAIRRLAARSETPRGPTPPEHRTAGRAAGKFTDTRSATISRAPICALCCALSPRSADSTSSSIRPCRAR
jgi:hypothetical protein